MAKDLLASLVEFRKHKKRPLRVILGYTGGTFFCQPNLDGRLEPLKDQSHIESLLKEGLHLDYFEDMGLLELKLEFIGAMDSSIMKEAERDLIVEKTEPHYNWADGMIIGHGTDSGAITAKKVHLAYSYFNVKELFNGKHIFNATKPIVVLSSQIPVAYKMKKDDKTIYFPSLLSDGFMNLGIGLFAIAEQRVGDAGLITNHTEILAAPYSVKGDEDGIPPYSCDKATLPIATLTSKGFRYSPQGYHQVREISGSPYVIKNSAKYEDQVLIISDASILDYIKRDLKANKKVGKGLPRMLLFEVSGDGNIAPKDYSVLKSAEEEGVLVFRVPIPGGRISTEQVYEVPGHDLPFLNMLSSTAKEKGIQALRFGEIEGLKQPSDRDAYNHLMSTQWSREFLLNR